MLFPYKFIPHKVERMQRFVNFIFFQVWSRAPELGPFRLDLFSANFALKEIMKAFSYDHTEHGDLFYSRVEKIYQLFAALNSEQIRKIKSWYTANNNIEIGLLNLNSGMVRYEDITEECYQELKKSLKEFFSNLYNDKLLGLAVLRKYIGTIDDHYSKFAKANDLSTCPFCGISLMLGMYVNKRDAYDHYLPKAKYPFNVVNLKNLVPACHHCNSNYKTMHDPAHMPKDPRQGQKRRRAFYPYTTGPHKVHVIARVLSPHQKELKPEDVELTFGPPDCAEQIDAWREMYGIDERYKGLLCGPESRNWLEEARIRLRKGKESPEDYLSDFDELRPYVGHNFLKRNFLKSYVDAGLFEVLKAHE